MIWGIDGKKMLIMYQVIKEINGYHGKEQYKLYHDGDYMGTISEKKLPAFLAAVPDLNDSDKIAQYLKYNNI